ncbi:MAG: anhydro-N-acetylmuramic acid kinase [Gammaproteobacteria bacterium]
MSQLYIGLMSGTSIDGIDAALVDFADTSPRLISTHCHPWPGQLHQALLESRKLPDDALGSLDALDNQTGNIFAQAANQLLEKAGVRPDEVIAIGSHGQTIRHRPDTVQPFSLQIGNAEVIAQQTGIDVVSDFRTADIAAGGQGAPLAPAFHAAVFKSEQEHLSVINIGGIANLTLLPGDTANITGFDSGPGNGLMDAWIHKINGLSYDRDGDWARCGQVNETLLADLLEDHYFSLPPPKSTGFEYFNLNWLESYRIRALRADDVQATLCELSARSIALAIKQYAAQTQKILICGGGAHNRHLMTRLGENLPGYAIASTEVSGVHPDWVEAMAFAWLAKQTIHQLPGNLPSVTGAHQAVVLGTITRH